MQIDSVGPYQLDSIHCGDAAVLMAAMPDGCIDLVVTSPVYDDMRAYNGYTWDFQAIARQLYRVIKPGGVTVWIVADQTVNGSETGTSFRQALYFMEIGFRLHDTMIYEVAGTGAKGSHYSYWQAFEYMFVLSKGRPTTNLLRDRRNTTAGKTIGTAPKAKVTGSRVKNGNYKSQTYGIRTNVWRYHTGANGDDWTIHPAPFPEALARDHILSWSNPGDLCLDPFCGSGTTLKMARETGRHFIGFDISAEYCRLSERRVAGARVPLPGLMEATS